MVCQCNLAAYVDRETEGMKRKSDYAHVQVKGMQVCSVVFVFRRIVLLQEREERYKPKKGISLVVQRSCKCRRNDEVH